MYVSQAKRKTCPLLGVRAAEATEQHGRGHQWVATFSPSYCTADSCMWWVATRAQKGDSDSDGEGYCVMRLLEDVVEALAALPRKEYDV